MTKVFLLIGIGLIIIPICLGVWVLSFSLFYLQGGGYIFAIPCTGFALLVTLGVYKILRSIIKY